MDSLVLALVVMVTLPVYEFQEPLILSLHFQWGGGLYGLVLCLGVGAEMVWGA